MWYYGDLSIVLKLIHSRQHAVAQAYQVQPTNEAIRLARTALLTRRVHTVLRAFNIHHEYTTNVPPRIEWDDTFIPPDLYPVTGSIPEAVGEVREDTGTWPSEGPAVDKGKGKERAVEETQELAGIGKEKKGPEQ